MELRDYLNVIRARRWIIIQAVAVVMITAVVVSLLQPPTYQGQAKILIKNQDVGTAIFGSSSGNNPVNANGGLDTQVQLVQLRPLAEKVVRSVRLPYSPDALLAKVNVSEIGLTNVITLTATDGNAARAADIANALADAYVQWSRDNMRASITAAANEVQTQLSQATSEALSLGQRVQTSPKSSQLTAELNIAITNYTQLALKLEELKVNEQLALGSGSVVSPAAVDPVPISPKPARDAVLGLVVGLAFGLGLAFLLEYLDNSIKSAEDVETLYGAPVLGHIPEEKVRKGEKRRLSIGPGPTGAAAEAYRVLRNNLSFVNFQNDIKTLLVTSSAPGEGKSTVAANLAAALVHSGAKVVLVNGDFRRPVTDEFFDVDNSVGLSDALLGRADLSTALQRSSDHLSVLNSGPMPPNPSELLGSQKMGEIVKILEELFDWVIVDSPPLLVAADTSALVRWADGVLVISRGGVSTRQAAKAGREMLERVGARVVGVVLWGLSDAASGVYGIYGIYGAYTRQPDDSPRQESGT